MTNIEIALIGSGPISHHHVNVLEDVGMSVTAVATMNPDSDTINDFSEKFGIENTFKGDSWRDMITSKNWDGIVIATHISGTPEAIKYCLTTNTPILVEKPVSWSSKTICRIRKKMDCENVIVGYNRRYYKTIRKAREFLDGNQPVMANIELPAASGLKSFIGMSTHGIDILRYLFGDLTVLSTYELTNKESLNGYTSTLRSNSGDLINIIGNWEAPANIGMNIDNQDTRFQIRPYEQARIYNGFNIKEPGEENQIKRYIPEKKKKINIENRGYKPGFYKQAQSYKKLIQEGEPSKQSATLYDAEKALEICENILPDRLPKEF